MNRNHALLLVVAAVAIGVTAGLLLRGRPGGEEALKGQVRAVLEEQVAAWNAGDLDRFLETYWDDDGLTFFSGGDVNQGLKAVRERYNRRYRAEGKEMGRLSFTELEVFILGEKEAVARARWRLEMKTDNPGGLFTLWLRKMPGGWKIVHDHTSAAEKKE